MPGQHLVDFPMARHRLFLAGGRVGLDIVSTAVPQQHASGREQRPEQVVALQRAMSLTEKVGGTSSNSISR